MGRKILLAGVLCLLSTVTASAQTYTYLVGSEPAFSVSMPDGWEVVTKPTARDPAVRRMTATAPEGIIWLAAWVVKDAKTIDQAAPTLADASEALMTGVKNLKEPTDGRVNGMKARHYELTWMVRLEDGKTEKFEARAVLFEPTEGRVAIAFCISDAQGLQKQRPQIDTIFKSLKPGGR